jgi:histidinol-phosphatase
VNDRDPAALASLAHRLLDDTDAILERYFAGEVETLHKADDTPVTIADREVEAFLRSRLGDAFPGHGFVGEEYGTEEGAGEMRWIIDPIDATANFVRGIPVFATLLALERAGELVLGVVSAPALGRRWWASVGGGAHVSANGRRSAIRVSRIDQLAQAQLCHSTLRTLDEEGLLPGWLSALRGSRRDRGFGDFWGHMLVAQGSAEAMLEYGVSPWDMAAPAAILVEAGGRMTDFSGNSSWSGPEVLSSNGQLHDELLAALRTAPYTRPGQEELTL